MSKTKLTYVWVYFLLFYLFWCLREMWLVQYIETMDDISKAFISAIIKILVWIVPVLLLVRMVEKRESSTYLGLREYWKNGLKWAGWGAIALIIYFVILNLALQNEIDFRLGFNEWLNIILLVGITEELVFRGFLLRKLMESFSFWRANIITALLFSFIHFPIWFYKGLFTFPSILGSILTAFVLGIIFGYIYKKSNSLWSVIIIHSFYNFLVLIFY